MAAAMSLQFETTSFSPTLAPVRGRENSADKNQCRPAGAQPQATGNVLLNTLTPSRSRRSTVSAFVDGSILTSPKNWKPE